MQAAEFIRSRSALSPRIGVVLGSGLGGFADRLTDSVRVPYADIPGFAAVGVAGHRGELVLGRISGVEVACLSGRVHLYEGHPPARVVFGVRLLAELGCRSVLLTNAAGGIRSDLESGTLLLVTDHVNLTGANPLLGPSEQSLPRFIADGLDFPDWVEAFAPTLSVTVIVDT